MRKILGKKYSVYPNGDIYEGNMLRDRLSTTEHEFLEAARYSKLEIDEYLANPELRKEKETAVKQVKNIFGDIPRSMFRDSSEDTFHEHYYKFAFFDEKRNELVFFCPRNECFDLRSVPYNPLSTDKI